MHSLRFPNEADDAFRARAECASKIARILIDACFSNHLIRQLLADGKATETSIRRNPTVRVEYEQAIAIGGVGETLDATRNKRWGTGPMILPIEPDDVFYPERITYLYRENSFYNRRFEQRIRLKELLGKSHRKLVGEAKYFTKELFLRRLSKHQAAAIRHILNVEPGVFWRAVQGKMFLSLPSREVQKDFDFGPD